MLHYAVLEPAEIAPESHHSQPDELPSLSENEKACTSQVIENLNGLGEFIERHAFRALLMRGNALLEFELQISTPAEDTAFFSQRLALANEVTRFWQSLADEC